MKLYENIVIGNFLYALGYSVRSKSKADIQPSMVNLLQQTPADKALADVLIEFTGITRLIEFKQASNNSKKEIAKHSLIKKAVGDGDEDLNRISRSVHWFIETEPKEDSFISSVSSYLDAFPRPDVCSDLWEFIDITANEAVKENSEFSPEDLSAYLSLIAGLNSEDYVGTGGLLVHIDSTGSIRYTELADMTQMRLSHKNYRIQMEKIYEKQNQRTQTNTKRLSRDLDRGMSL